MAGRDLTLRLLIKAKDEVSKVVGRIRRRINTSFSGVVAAVGRVKAAFLSWVQLTGLLVSLGILQRRCT